MKEDYQKVLRKLSFFFFRTDYFLMENIVKNKKDLEIVISRSSGYKTSPEQKEKRKAKKSRKNLILESWDGSILKQHPFQTGYNIQQIQKIKYIQLHWVFAKLSLILQKWQWQNLSVIIIEWLFFKTPKKQKIWDSKYVTKHFWRAAE